jgi:hypothetical protein
MYQFAQGFAAVGLLLWFLRVVLDRWVEHNRKTPTPKVSSDQPMESLHSSRLEHRA